MPASSRTPADRARVRGHVAGLAVHAEPDGLVHRQPGDAAGEQAEQDQRVEGEPDRVPDAAPLGRRARADQLTGRVAGRGRSGRLLAGRPGRGRPGGGLLAGRRLPEPSYPGSAAPGSTDQPPAGPRRATAPAPAHRAGGPRVPTLLSRAAVHELRTCSAGAPGHRSDRAPCPLAGRTGPRVPTLLSRAAGPRAPGLLGRRTGPRSAARPAHRRTRPRRPDLLSRAGPRGRAVGPRGRALGPGVGGALGRGSRARARTARAPSTREPPARRSTAERPAPASTGDGTPTATTVDCRPRAPACRGSRGAGGDRAGYCSRPLVPGP